MTLLHPTDFSECAAHALEHAVRLARRLGASLVLLHVPVETPLYGEGLTGATGVREVYESQRRWAEAALDERAVALRADGLEVRTRVVPGAPWEQIVKVASEERVELIVIGTHGRGTLGRLLLGSVADRVVRLAPCPVVTVRVAPRPGGA